MKIIPSGWKHSELNQLVSFQRGFDITKSEQRDGKVPVVSSSGTGSYHSLAKATGPAVVIGRKGTLGTVHYLEEDYWPHDTTLWSRDLHGNVGRYVYYYLHLLKLERFDTGSSNPTLNRNHIHKLPVWIPPLKTQKRIAEILSAYDDLIEANRRRMELLEESARLLYREWFVHLRFPGHETTPIHDGLPEGWERTTLSDLVDTNPSSFTAKTLPDEIDYVDLSAVKAGRISHSTFFLKEDTPGRARRRAQKHDTIWANVRPNLKGYALVGETTCDCVFSTGFTVLSPKAESAWAFIYLTVSSDHFVKHLENHATGSSYPAVRPPDFERFKFAVPPKCILAAFHQKTSLMLEARDPLTQQNQKLAEARDLLLPRLMSGEIEV